MINRTISFEKKLGLTSLVAMVALFSASQVTAMEDICDKKFNKNRSSNLKINIKNNDSIIDPYAIYCPAQTQEEINRIVIETASQVYEKIHQNWTYIVGKNIASTKSKMWQPVIATNGITENNGIKTQRFKHSLVLKTTPEKLIDALEDLISKPASLECTIALETARIFCLRKILGNGFNDYVAVMHETLSPEDFIHELCTPFLSYKKGKAIPGSMTYIANIPLYSTFKPNGNDNGINVVCTADDQYLGFEEMFKSAPKSCRDVGELFFNKFNNKEDLEAQHKYHETLRKKYQKNPTLFFKLFYNSQKTINGYNIFDITSISNYVKTGKIALKASLLKKNNQSSIEQDIDLDYLETLFSKATNCALAEDTTSAMRLWKEAADKGHRQSQFVLGEMYSKAKPLNKTKQEREENLKKARKYYTLAAAQMHSTAMCELGRFMMLGDGGPMDKQKGLTLISETAEAGEARAQYYAGVLYMAGEDVPKDVERGLSYLYNALEQGEEEAQTYINKYFESIEVK